MHFGITARFKRSLAQGVAILMLGGIVAGCSSAANLTDGLVTNSTSASAPVRPKVPVGNGSMQTAARTSPQPLYPRTQSAPAISRSSVSSAPLPPPGGSREQGRSQEVALASTPSNAGNAASSSTVPESPSRNIAASSAQEQKPEMSAQPQANNASAQGEGTYKVASGDTLYAISQRTGVSIDRIAAANNLSGNTVRLGQTLTIPGGNTSQSVARAKQPESVSSDEKEPTQAAATTTPEEKPKVRQVSVEKPQASDRKPEESIQAEVKDEAADKAEEKQVASLGQEASGASGLRWPVRGRVISAFGSGSSDGINIAVPEGTAIHAAENGVVIYAGDGLKGFGNTVLVRHDNGLVTVYGHASKLNVKRGDKVTRGQELALSGMSGEVDRPQLHFEVRKGTSPVDPMSYLN